MKVELEHAASNQNVDKSTILYQTSKSEKTNTKSGYAVDISGTVMDNKAYKGQGKTAEDVMQEAEQVNVAALKDYMTVMSNSMSAEDFAALEKDGFPIGSVDADKIVTVVDKIKTELLIAGVEISGYTDSLDKDTLKIITGDTARAEVIASKLKEYDLPDTKENAKEIQRTLEKAKPLEELKEGTIKYMVENKMEPTIDNIYRAQFSSSSDTNRQGRGYFSEGTPGYYGKKAEEYNWEQLQPQIEKTIEEAGKDCNQETQESAKWLIEKGIPLTKESLTLLEDLKKLTLPQEEKDMIDTIVRAMANGQKAENANLLVQPYYLKEAITVKEALETLTEDDVRRVIVKEQKITLQNLFQAQKDSDAQQQRPLDKKQAEAEIKARRQLEEVRLSMSVQANLKLLKKGFSIQTQELEQLVEQLKKLEQETGGTLWEETLNKTHDLQKMPAAVITRLLVMPRNITLNEVHSQGTLLKNAYEAAEKTYEAVMTAPRKDLGDSIQKAFRNVDDILEDLDFEKTDYNRRAVRILGYNSMAITKDKIEEVKEADISLQRVLKKMTPHHTLELIKKGINPLETGLEELEGQLDEIAKEGEDDSEQYAKFLYKLEKNKQITSEEKNAYIGIYRLMKQVEKSDGAIIGSLLNQGAEISFKNLLGAARSNKQKGMNLTIDDNFGTLQSTQNRDNTISQQITNYYHKLAQEIGEELEPERIATLKITEETGLEQIADMLKNAEISNESETEYLKEKTKEFRKFEVADEHAMQVLLDYNQPVNAENLLAADSAMNARGEMYRQLNEYYKKTDGRTTEETFLKNVETIQENLTDKDSLNTAFEQMKDVVKRLVTVSIEVGTIEAKDMKALSLLYKQITFTRNMAQEENYEIPVSINGEITSVNLKVLHNKNEAPKVTAAMQTEKYGKVAAEFSITNGEVKGYIACSDEEGLRELKQIEEKFAENLEKNKIKEGNVVFIHSRQLNLKTFGKKETTPESSTSTKELYQVAKSLIYALQNM